jgi:hypothetical protein
MEQRNADWHPPSSTEHAENANSIHIQDLNSKSETLSERYIFPH